MQIMNKAVLLLAGTLALLSGCSSTTPTVGSNVTYGNATDVERVNIAFGSTDLQMMAEAMARSLSEYSAENSSCWFLSRLSSCCRMLMKCCARAETRGGENQPRTGARV